MPDQRKHRGPHPEDRRLFAASNLPDLRAAAGDLNWLLSRGYASNSALKLVGDRYGLEARQRVAIGRCVSGDVETTRRRRHEIDWPELECQELWIDGYNVLTTVEVALSGGVILHALDGCYRDMASMHGSYRKVAETMPALTLMGELLDEWNVTSCHWLLDQPVSNSGRLKGMIEQVGDEHGWQWQAELVPNPDPVLMGCDKIVASADSQILDRARRWLNLARLAIDRKVAEAWIVHLSEA